MDMQVFIGSLCGTITVIVRYEPRFRANAAIVP